VFKFGILLPVGRPMVLAAPKQKQNPKYLKEIIANNFDLTFQNSVIPMRNFIFIAAMSLLAHWATAQASAHATVDSTHMLIGDQMRLHLEVTVPPGTAVEPLRPPQDTASAIEFLGESPWDTLPGILKKDLIFTAWDSGYQQVPPLPVVFLLNGRRDSVFTASIPIRVEMPPADSTLTDIKPIIEEPVKIEDYLPYAGTLLTVLLIAFFVWMMRRHIAKKELPPPPPVILPAHEIAFEKLEALKKEKLWQRGQLKAYHSQLTYIVREYLESRYGIQALEETTDEILEQMRNMRLGDLLTEKMTALLQTADLVKFAKAQPPAGYHDRAMAMAETFILETKPAALTAAETGADDVA
jgi:hypothetical protein